MILTILVLIIYTVKSLHLLYLFQTKEYRFDRILAYIREENIFQTLYIKKVKFPAISLRNLFISWGLFFNIVPLYILLKNSNLLTQIILLLLTPVIALFFILLGVIFSEIPSRLYRKYLIKKAAALVASSKAIFIGITGSYAKTTTKELLFQILATKFKVAKTEKNYNSDVGVAISVLKNLKPNTEFFIAELGAYRKGEIKSICKLIKPKYGILTGIGNQHLSLFGSKRNLLEAKAELIESLPINGVAYINKDINEWHFFANKTRAKKVFYTVSELPFEIKSNLLGEHIIQNLLPCISLASHLGVDKDRIMNTIKNLKPIRGRLSQRTGFMQCAILDDSYNSNVNGFITAVKTANQLSFQKKYIISRGLIELGAEKNQSYKKIIDELNKTDLILVTTDKLFKILDEKNKVMAFQNEIKLLDYIKGKADKKTLIVIEGRLEPNTLKSIFAKN